ncbi:MAG: asparagine synthetase B, partial [Sphingobacteriales bacterium]
MCGIAGIIASDIRQVTEHGLKLMTDSLAHRGPDGEQHWISPDGQAGFGHRRLAILDLSEAAAQPMHYGDRYTIIHNGEIYNYIELRTSLKSKGYTFNSGSDTEVILAAYDFYGHDCITRFEGMFAFAIWDRQEKKLFAARDRFGEKPFCYSMRNNMLVFGSEPKAIRAIDDTYDLDQPR